MTTLFKTVLCPRCNEDYLLITQYADTKELYLSCSECEASWRHPEDINDSSKMFVDLDIDATDPTLADIKAFGWERYISGTLESQ